MASMTPSSPASSSSSSSSSSSFWQAWVLWTSRPATRFTSRFTPRPPRPPLQPVCLPACSSWFFNTQRAHTLNPQFNEYIAHDINIFPWFMLSLVDSIFDIRIDEFVLSFGRLSLAVDLYHQFEAWRIWRILLIFVLLSDIFLCTIT